MPLSDIAIKNLKPAPKAKKYADGEGLFLFVTVKGTKSWRFRYRNFAGIEQEMFFGLYPEISLLSARNLKFEARKLVALGKDPLSEKRDRERAAVYNLNNTFFAVAKEWFDLKKDEWTNRHSQKIWNRFEKYVFPTLGNKVASDISGLEILDIIRKIEGDGKTETSRKLFQNCSSVFRLAFLTKRVPYNPLGDLRGILKSHKSERYPTIKIGELPEFLNKLEASAEPELYKLAMKLLILTFLRQGELRKSKWEYLDLEKRVWTVPAELMKNREDHIVPLSNQVIEILYEIKMISGNSEYLFPTGNMIKHPYMNQNVLNNIIHSLKYKGKLVAHGFRSLASTTLNECGPFPERIIERQLAHSDSNQVRAAYNRAEYLPQRIEMMQWWADHIDELRQKADEQLKKAA